MAGEKETITIDKLVTGGMGLGRLANGMVAMVAGALAGEQVAVRPTRKRGGYWQAELVEVVEPAAERGEPPCPHYRDCGGCDLQHVAAEQQVTVKAAILKEHLLRQGGFDPQELDAVWLEPLASPRLLGYRQRIRLQVESGRLGFLRRSSHQLEAVSGCLLARPEINTVLGRLSESPAMTLLLRQSRELELLASPADHDVVLLLHFGRKPRPTDRQVALAAVAETGVRGLLLRVEGQGLFGPFGNHADELLLRFTLPRAGTETEELLLTVEPGGFSQVNPDQNRRLVEQLLGWVSDRPPARVLDCHCGMGNFSLPLATVAGEVVGCDVQGAAIRSARRNAQLNGLANCRFEKMPAVDFVGRLVDDGEAFDLLLLDPPRQGCGELVPLLGRLGAERIVYISCDHATLSRDLAALADHGYQLRRLRMVDMFPQTHHLEVITLLEYPATAR